ncbi:MAG: nucleotide pyrophosphohydrolase [Steroidobacter sp.]
MVGVEAGGEEGVAVGAVDAHSPRHGNKRCNGVINMKFSDLEKSALGLNELYEQLEIKLYGRVWSTEELALGFVGDVGDLAKLIQANAGVRRIDDCKAKLGHELADCLWSIIVLANKCGIDLEAEYFKNTRELTEHVSGELEK